MKAEKLNFEIGQEREVALGIFQNPEIGYFSSSSLERALKEAGCKKELARSVATAVTKDIFAQIADECQQLPTRHLLSGFGLKLKMTTVLLPGSSEPVTLYYAEATVKEAQAQRGYELEVQSRLDKQHEEIQRHTAEAVSQVEAQQVPPDVVISLVPYRSGSTLEEQSDYINASDAEAERNFHPRFLPDKSDGYTPILTSFIGEDVAFGILKSGITPAEFETIIQDARKKIIAETGDLLANSETIAQGILSDASTTHSPRRGIAFFRSTLLQRQYVVPVHEILEKDRAATPNVKAIVVADPFYDGEYPYPVEAAYNWMGRYDDQNLTAYQESLAELIQKGDQRAVTLQEIIKIPNAFTRLKAGESIHFPGGTNPLTKEDVDELLAPVILDDAYLAKGIFTDIIRTGFLQRENDNGGSGELYAIALKLLSERFSQSEILEALRFELIDIDGIDAKIEDIKAQVRIGQKGLAKLSGGKRTQEQKRINDLQNKIPSLSQQLRQAPETNRHPVYTKVLAAVSRKALDKSPQADGQSERTKIFNALIPDLLGMLLPNY